jgi:hypothetical protein
MRLRKIFNDYKEYFECFYNEIKANNLIICISIIFLGGISTTSGKPITLNEATRSVYPLLKLEGDSIYVLHGASVLIGFTEEKTMILLTNKHIASSRESLYVPITVIDTLNRKDTSIVIAKAYSGKRAIYPNWCDSLDIAAIIFPECFFKPVNYFPDEFYVINIENIEDKLPDIGSEIFMGGFPFSYGVYSEKLIIPVLRSGIISHPCIEECCKECIAMHDAFSYGGNSGGPIFMTHEIFKSKRNCSSCVSLIGINMRHDNAQTQIFDLKGNQIPYLSIENSGLSFFIPAQVVKKFLKQVELELKKRK